jgi:hypothetical protein
VNRRHRHHSRPTWADHVQRHRRVTVYAITDYPNDDMASVEVDVAVRGAFDRRGIRAEVVRTSVPNMDTDSLGFLLPQIAMGIDQPATAILHYVGPRWKARAGQRPTNVGESLYTMMYAGPRSDVMILGSNAGRAWSLLSDRREPLREVPMPTTVHRQFLVRDIYPDLLAQVATGAIDLTDLREVDKGSVPPLPPGRIGYVDNFGVIKTTYRSVPEGLSIGDVIDLTINGRSAKAVVGTYGKGVPEGYLYFGPASSGGDRPFYDIFRPIAPAVELFGIERDMLGRSIAGGPIEIEKVADIHADLDTRTIVNGPNPLGAGRTPGPASNPPGLQL